MSLPVVAFILTVNDALCNWYLSEIVFLADMTKTFTRIKFKLAKLTEHAHMQIQFL